MTTKPYGEPTRVPGIPDTRHAQVQDVLNALKELMEVREGVRGDGLDKNVTLRDLLNSGLATPFDLRGLAPGGGGFPLLPTPPADPDIPPTPTNLVASGAFKYILLTWDFARGYSRLAYFEIWRSTTEVIGDAVLIGQTFAPIYADEVGPGKTYYYWVRAMSDAPAASPFNALMGTPGSTAMDPAEVMKAMLEKLGYGEVDIANGVFPFTTVTELPVLPNPKYPPGVCVLLLADGKLYRNDNNVWTTAVDASDVTGQLVEAQIANSAITTAKFAQGIEPVSIVASLPVVAGYTGPKVVFLTSDGKMYRLTGGAWTAAVPAADITGQLISAQIADAAMTIAKFAQGIEPVSIVAALPVVAGYTGPKVVMLTTDGKLYRLTGGVWTSAVPTVDLTGQITGVQITNDAITAPKIAANAVTATTILAGAVESTKLATDSVIAGKIAAGAVNAREIAAGAITAEKLLVASVGSALNADPGFEDRSAWNAGTIVNIGDGKVGNKAMRSTDNVPTDIHGTKFIPCDSSKVYRVRAWARKSLGTNGTLYIGVQCLDSAGNNVPGNGTFWYTGAVNAQIGTGWLDFVGNLNGSGAELTFGDNCRTMTPIALLNYGGTTGYMEIQDLRIEEVLPGTLIQDGAITTDKITANAITSAKIAAGAVTADKIEANSITAGQIASGAISTDELAANAVSAVKIAAGAIDADKLAANSVTAGKIAAGAVDADKLAANSVIAGKIGAGAIVAGDGVIANAAIGTAHIQNAAITTALIGNLQVDDAKVANLSVAKLLAGALSVGAYVESSNYLAGDTGFRIHGNGNAELNNATVRGTIIARTGAIGNIWMSETVGMYTSNYVADTSGWYLDHNGNAHFNNAYIRGTLYAVNGTLGNLEVTGSLRSGQTGFDTGTGYWWGQSGGITKFSVGTGPTGPALIWDGATLRIRGATYDPFTATASKSGIASRSNTTSRVSMGTATLAVDGAQGTVMYQWAVVSVHVSPDNGTAMVSLTNANASTVTVMATASSDTYVTAVVACTAVDSATNRTVSGSQIMGTQFGTPT